MLQQRINEIASFLEKEGETGSMTFEAGAVYFKLDESVWHRLLLIEWWSTWILS